MMEETPALNEPFQALQVEPGASQEVELPYEYDTLLVIPPYTQKEKLKTLGLSWNLRRQVGVNLTMHEAYHLYVIQDGELQGYTLLGADFSTTNSGDLLRIDAPDLLTVRHIPNKNRPLVLGTAKRSSL
ncbi:hypothetical protein CBW65_05360 [Tumebacillus avium]|uniref:Uncharacterized protein n=2 Tax=Tumebacillus avium TaxID=1903704 RepID=A0A1Y0IJC1_9BACL|nr:hypothetical protein CBW65_05360 [Tumebacillus avium]